MADFKFFHPIEVRFGDLDPQGHVNNAKYLTYMEQARTQYVRRLGIWPGGSFQDLGVILADAHLTFRAQITFGQTVRVGVRVASIGNKSFIMEYLLEDPAGGKELARAETVQVAFDYRSGKSIPVPPAWREAILQFEGLEDQETG